MLAIYIHWPFCKSKCPYCDFNSHVSNSIDEKQWLEAYFTEMDYFSGHIEGKKISSIFFGGGTPSLMPPFIVEGIINKLAENARFNDDIEITLEGNPTSVEAAKYRDFHSAGVNRVSLGVQALNATDLKFLGREHSETEALKAIDIARDIFSNYSFDLIYARPTQTVSDWEKELVRAISHAGNHLSLYQLTIEKGTAFYADYRDGKFVMPDEELAAELYELTYDITADAGLDLYEISNYAKSGFDSKHNMTYWEYGDYLGFGPGAHSRIKTDGRKASMTMIHKPENWLKSIGDNGHAIQQRDILPQQEIFEEALMMGLRTKKGIGWDKFKYETSCDLREKLPQPALNGLVANNLIEIDNIGIRATRNGFLLLDSLLSKLV